MGMSMKEALDGLEGNDLALMMVAVVAAAIETRNNLRDMGLVGSADRIFRDTIEAGAKEALDIFGQEK